jgi:hypothetical protein
MNQSHRYFDVQAYSINHRSLVSARFYDRTRKRLYMTDSPNWVNNRTTSVEYRFLSSMQGSMGVGANLDKWTPDDFAIAKDMIAPYKQVRETVQHGSLYRLISPQESSEYSATESVSLDKQQAVLFTFLHSSQKGYPSVAFICVVSIPPGNTTCASSTAPSVGCSGGRQQKLLDEPWRHVLLRETFKPQVCLVLILTSRLV